MCALHAIILLLEKWRLPAHPDIVELIVYVEQAGKAGGSGYR
jgi:hypothetical protein